MQLDTNSFSLRDNTFAKGKPMLDQPDTVTFSVNMGKTANIAYMGFSKVFNAVFNSLFLDKLTNYRLDGWSVMWVRNWQRCLTQRVVINVFYLDQAACHKWSLPGTSGHQVS